MFSVLGLELYVDFDSAGNEGDNVEMTCEYTNIGNNFFVLYWYGKTGNTPQAIWQYHGTKNSSVSNEAIQGYASKFEYIPQTFHDETHKIRLLNAMQEDEGLYWCYIQVIGDSAGGSEGTSPQRQLEVGE